MNLWRYVPVFEVSRAKLNPADVVKLVATLDLDPSAVMRESSSLSVRTLPLVGRSQVVKAPRFDRGISQVRVLPT